MGRSLYHCIKLHIRFHVSHYFLHTFRLPPCGINLKYADADPLYSTINNLSQDYSYTIGLSGGTALARVDAEWIVEDPAGGSGLEPFAAFTDIWFEEVYANTNISTTLGVDASTMYSINSNTCVAVEYDDGDFYAYSD